MQKKVNPRRIPRTQADVERAERESRDFALSFVFAIVFYCLWTYFGWSKGRLWELWRRANIVAADIKKHSLSIREIKKVVLEECEIDVDGKETE